MDETNDHGIWVAANASAQADTYLDEAQAQMPIQEQAQWQYCEPPSSALFAAGSSTEKTCAQPSWSAASELLAGVPVPEPVPVQPDGWYGQEDDGIAQYSELFENINNGANVEDALAQFLASASNTAVSHSGFCLSSTLI